MAKRKTICNMEQKLIKKYKINPCFVNMAVLNPALYILDYTVDVMLELDKPFKTKTILRIMNGYANSKKPLIPISYINTNEIERIIVRAEQLTEFTNVEALIPDYFSQVSNESQDGSIIQSIYNRLKKKRFRKTDFFKSIKINCEGLFDTILHLNCKNISYIKSTDNLKSFKDPSVNPLEDISENNAFLINIVNNCRSQEEFVECTNVIQLANLRILKLGLLNVSVENRNTLIDIIIRNTWKQIKAKLNIVDNFSNESSSSESNVMVTRYYPENIISLADQQTIVVPEYNTQLEKLCAKKIEHGSFTKGNMERTRSTKTQLFEMGGDESIITHVKISKNIFPELFSKSRQTPNKLPMCKIQHKVTNENNTLRNKLLKQNPADSSSVEFVANKLNQIITVEDTPTKSQRIAAILDSPVSPANLSEVPNISYAGTVVNPKIIKDMRKKNCKKKISKNPELEIPIMRNTYRPLRIKNKFIL